MPFSDTKSIFASKTFWANLITTAAAVVTLLAGALAAPLLATFIQTGLVPRLPTAVLCTGLMLIASLLGACGLILDSLARSRVEQKRMFYLAVARDELN